MLALPIRLRDGVGVDDEFLCQWSDAGQLLAWPERPGLNAVLHLLHELEVNRDARRWIGSKQHHTVTVLVNYYTTTVGEDVRVCQAEKSPGYKDRVNQRMNGCFAEDSYTSDLTAQLGVNRYQIGV